jgi:conjugative relaxase-like TrwC/TraI family protein
LALGAAGPVDRDGLTRILAGAHPGSASKIVADHARRVPGFDLTFSAPKSVSVLFGLGDEPLRRTIRSEHEAAVEETIAYMQRVAARGRRGRGGKVLIEGEGFVAAGFRHRTSRAGDPQLHTHVLVATLVEGHDGRWSASDGRGIYQHAKTAGYLYEAALRERLTRRLGVEWTPARNGIADIEGVPASVLRTFSRRRAEVEAERRRRGESSAAAARMATLATRRRKDYGVVPDELMGEWRTRAARLGFDRASLRALQGRAGPTPEHRGVGAVRDVGRHARHARRGILPKAGCLPTAAPAQARGVAVRPRVRLSAAALEDGERPHCRQT